MPGVLAPMGGGSDLTECLVRCTGYVPSEQSAERYRLQRSSEGIESKDPQHLYAYNPPICGGDCVQSEWWSWPVGRGRGTE